MRLPRLATLISIPVLGLAACGGGSDSTTQPTEAPIAPGSPAASPSSFNDADVLFAQSMIPHHEQAIEMADIALDPAIGAGPAVKDLATRIKGAQDPEIQQMTAMLTGWGKPVQMDTSDGHDMASMDGMMSADQMTELETLTGAEFDRAWAAMMIEHHEGAITMAQTVKAAGSNPDVLTLADAVISAQQAEITEMQPLAA